MKIWHAIVGFFIVKLIQILNGHNLFGEKGWFIVYDLVSYGYAIVLVLFIWAVIATIVRAIRKKKET